MRRSHLHLRPLEGALAPERGLPPPRIELLVLVPDLALVVDQFRLLKLLRVVPPLPLQITRMLESLFNRAQLFRREAGRVLVHPIFPPLFPMGLGRKGHLHLHLLLLLVFLHYRRSRIDLDLFLAQRTGTFLLVDLGRMFRL